MLVEALLHVILDGEGVVDLFKAVLGVLSRRGAYRTEAVKDLAVGGRLRGGGEGVGVDVVELSERGSCFFLIHFKENNTHGRAVFTQRKMFPERNLHYASSNIFMDRAYEPHIHHTEKITSLGGLMPRTKGKLYSAAGYAATLPRDRRTSEPEGEHGVDMFHEDPLTLKRGDNLRFFRKKPDHVPQYSPYLNNLENQRKVHQYQREAEMIRAPDSKAYIPRAQINLEVDEPQTQAPPHRSYDERAVSRQGQLERAHSRQEQHSQPKDTLDVEINRSLDPSL